MNLNARASVTDWYDDYVLAVRESEIFFFYHSLYLQNYFVQNLQIISHNQGFIFAQ